MYTGIKQLNKWMINDGSQNSQYWSREVGDKGVFQNNLYSNGLEFETSV